VNLFVDSDPDFRDFNTHKMDSRDESRNKTNRLFVKILKKFKFTTENYEK
jgi:hypothetical protein